MEAPGKRTKRLQDAFRAQQCKPREHPIAELGSFGKRYLEKSLSGSMGRAGRLF